ncbi:MAG TPA: TetR/AcrR family transcriptional regulator [Candidatus Ventricola gallistercoris]|nr:TetR/AcrR family transcriptional regulator [Candidatus Ventricola gallistercoris]
MARRQTKRSVQAASSRNILLKAATTLFHEHEYADVTVDDICAAAGLTKGAFYYHFASKEELHNQLYTPQLDAYLDAHYRLPEEPTAYDRLMELARCTFQFSVENDQTLTAQSISVMVNQKSSYLYSQPRTHTRLLDEAIDAAVSEGVLRPKTDHQETILLYACMMTGFLLKWVSSSGEESRTTDWNKLLSEEIRLLLC